MARFFGADSVQDFAEEILKSDSEWRLSRLRSFYSHKSPELKDAIKKTFPKPNTEPKPPTSPTLMSSTVRQRPTSKRTLPNSPPKPQVGVPTHEVHDQREETSKGKRMGGTETSEVHHYRSTDLTNKKIKTSSSTDDLDQIINRSSFPSTSSEYHQRNQCAPVGESKTNGASSSSVRPSRSSSDSIADLIGDTSILNDLFKSKKKPVDRPKEATTPTFTEKTKSRGKDFWDILNEGNEESINKLTDLSEVEKICNTASVPARSKSKDKSESSQLWKKNEKFLWKI